MLPRPEALPLYGRLRAFVAGAPAQLPELSAGAADGAGAGTPNPCDAYYLLAQHRLEARRTVHREDRYYAELADLQAWLFADLARHPRHVDAWVYLGETFARCGPTSRPQV